MRPTSGRGYSSQGTSAVSSDLSSTHRRAKQPIWAVHADVPRVTPLERAAALGDPLLKALNIEPLALNGEPVTAAARHQQPVTQRLTQMRNVAVNDLDRAPRRLLAPQLADQAIGRHHLTAMQQQHGQQSALHRAAQLHPPPGLKHLKRTKNQKVEPVVTSQRQR
jgi:hypothetical protein